MNNDNTAQGRRPARAQRIARVKFVALAPEPAPAPPARAASPLAGLRAWILRAIGGLEAARPQA